MSKQAEPNDAASHFNRAMDYAKAGKLSQAIAELDETIRLNPDSAQAYLHRGFVYYDRAFTERVRNAQGLGIINPKDLGQAIADYSKAIELGENGGNVYYERGMTYARLKDAIRMAGATLVGPAQQDMTASQGGSIWKSEGAAVDREGYEDLAWADLNHAIALQPEIALAHYERGLLNAGRGYRTAAIRDYSEAIRLDPDHASAYYNRALMYMREESERKKAIADLESVLKISKDPSLIMDTEGLLKKLRGGWLRNIFH